MLTSRSSHRARRVGLPLVLLVIVALLGGIGSAAAQPVSPFDSVPPTQLPSDLVLDWVDAIYTRLRDERLNPPEAARIYGYMGVTIYESVVAGWPENRSLSGQMRNFGAMPTPEDGLYDWLTVVNAALRTVMVDLMLERGADNIAYFDDIYADQLADRTAAVDDAAIIERSISYGEEVGKAILNWATADGYADMPPADQYEIETGDGLWQMTSPGMLPVEPFWGQVRPFMLNFADQCANYEVLAYNTDADSTIYQQAIEVMDTVDNLTPEQRDIALWWMDDPGDTGLPSGHWIEIASYILAEDDASLMLTAEVYGMLGPVVADSFIAAWSLKYQLNSIRPVTYINDHISPRWQPLIETPFFPDHPSAHSVVSQASAEILDFFFGTRAFVDRANEDRGLGVRQYLSFQQAAYEAGISRLYGGIHFRNGIERGWQMGNCIAQHALDQTIMRPFQQG